jgi:Domain of unknown function (DUF4136)
MIGAAIALCVLGCTVSRDLRVEYDYSYHGQFKKYKTYNYLKQSLPEPSNSNGLVETHISARLNFLGFTIDDKPDVLVSYQIITDSMRMNVYAQPPVGHWASRASFVQHGDDNLFRYNKRSVDKKDGAIMIQLIDTRTNTQIWHGYTLMTYRKMDYDNSMHVRSAVVSILSQYNVWADGFMHE